MSSPAMVSVTVGNAGIDRQRRVGALLPTYIADAGPAGIAMVPIASPDPTPTAWQKYFAASKTDQPARPTPVLPARKCRAFFAGALITPRCYRHRQSPDVTPTGFPGCVLMP